MWAKFIKLRKYLLQALNPRNHGTAFCLWPLSTFNYVMLPTDCQSGVQLIAHSMSEYSLFLACNSISTLTMARIKVQDSHVAVYRPMQLHVETCWENVVANWSQCWEEQHQKGSCSVAANVFTGRAHALVSPIAVNRPQRKTLKQMTVLPQFLSIWFSAYERQTTFWQPWKSISFYLNWQLFRCL